MIRLAFYGKGGIGKSTISASISSYLAKQGNKVLHIGCDPKADSIRTLVNVETRTFLEVFQEKREQILLNDFVYEGPYGMCCIEAGGPLAGVGCAGMGIATMIDQLSKLDLFKQEWDYIIYDVLGDVVCGGFALPIKENLIDKVYIVSSAEYMSLYAANNILKSIENYDNENKIMGGYIFNKMSTDNDYKAAQLFSEYTNTPILSFLENSDEIKKSDMRETTVIKLFENSPITKKFTDICNYITNDNKKVIINSLDKSLMNNLRKEIINMEKLSNGNN